MDKNIKSVLNNVWIELHEIKAGLIEHFAKLGIIADRIGKEAETLDATSKNITEASRSMKMSSTEWGKTVDIIASNQKQVAIDLKTALETSKPEAFEYEKLSELAGTFTMENVKELALEIVKAMPTPPSEVTLLNPPKSYKPLEKVEVFGKTLTKLEGNSKDSPVFVEITNPDAIKAQVSVAGGSGGGSTPAADLRLDSGKIPVTGVVTTTSPTVIYTPSTGKRIRLFWAYALNDPDSTLNPLITISIGSMVCYMGYAIAHTEIFDGAINDSLTVTLDQAGSVAVTLHIKEVN